MNVNQPQPGDSLLLMKVTTHEDGAAYLVEGHDKQDAYEQFGQDITIAYYIAVLMEDANALALEPR